MIYHLVRLLRLHNQYVTILHYCTNRARIQYSGRACQDMLDCRSRLAYIWTSSWGQISAWRTCRYWRNNLVSSSKSTLFLRKYYLRVQWRNHLKFQNSEHVCSITTFGLFFLDLEEPKPCKVTMHAIGATIKRLLVIHSPNKKRSSEQSC